MKYIFVLLIMLIGCVPINYNLKPIAIYTLDDGSKVKVYQTRNEKIYIRNTSFGVIPK